MSTTAEPTAREGVVHEDGHHVSPWLVLVLVCLAQFMVILDATIVNVALPSIQADLGFTTSSLQWVINSYALTFGGFLLLGGRAGDLLGRKRVFLTGVVVFTSASLLNGLSTSSEMLVVARALQGLGGALVSPAALSIIIDTFPEGQQRNKALAVWSAIASGGAAFGLILGGVLTDTLSWEWIFFVNVPIGIATFIASLRFVPESRAAGLRRAFDFAGAVSVTAGLMVLVYAIVKANDYGWLSVETLVAAAVAFALLAAFIVIERRSTQPLVRLSIFRLRSLSAANGVMLLAAGGLFAMFFFATLYVQIVMGYSPLRAGFAFLPVTAGIGISAGIASQLVRKVDVRWVAIAGLLTAALGLGLLTQIDAPGTYLADLLPGLLVMSLGMGLTFVPLTLIATTNVEGADAGLASGLFNTSQQIGGALGLAILSTVAANITGGSRLPADLVDGYRAAFVVGALLLLAGAVAVAVVLRREDVASVNPEQLLVPAGA